MSVSSSRNKKGLRRVGAIGSGAVLVYVGVLGLINLQNTGGNMVPVLQAYCIVAAAIGTALIYGGVVQPRSLRRIVVVTFQVSAVALVLPSLAALYGGLTSGGELAPLFVVIGIIGSLMALLARSASIAVEEGSSAESSQRS